MSGRLPRIHDRAREACCLIRRRRHSVRFRMTASDLRRRRWRSSRIPVGRTALHDAAACGAPDRSPGWALGHGLELLLDPLRELESAFLTGGHGRVTRREPSQFQGLQRWRPPGGIGSLQCEVRRWVRVPRQSRLAQSARLTAGDPPKPLAMEKSETIEEPSASRSPLKSKPLRLPGQSVQEALDDEVWDRFFPYLLAALFFSWAAAVEWLAVWRHFPRQPWLYTSLAALAIVACGWQFRRMRRRTAALKLGRDGERAVGQFLERLREQGAHVFHDIPAENFNLDHVVLSPRGVFVIETKTRSKPVGRDARVTLTQDSLRIGGFAPDRDPVRQVEAGARWLAELLEESTGKRFAVRGVVLFTRLAGRADDGGLEVRQVAMGVGAEGVAPIHRTRARAGCAGGSAVGRLASVAVCASAAG
jgi:hypothetical protein